MPLASLSLSLSLSCSIISPVGLGSTEFRIRIKRPYGDRVLESAGGAPFPKVSLPKMLPGLQKLQAAGPHEGIAQERQAGAAVELQAAGATGT